MNVVRKAGMPLFDVVMSAGCASIARLKSDFHSGLM